jgi:predicted transcriptional regulator
MIVSEVMNRVATISVNITLRHAARVMSREGIGSLVLMKKDKAKGIITERDIIKNIDKIDKKISTVMSKKLVTVDGWEQLEEVAKIMKKHGIKRVLVRGKKRELIGIVTATDMIANADLFNAEMDFI